MAFRRRFGFGRRRRRLQFDGCFNYIELGPTLSFTENGAVFRLLLDEQRQWFSADDHRQRLQSFRR